MLKYVEITNKNIQYATKIQMEIFPYECAYQAYKDSIDKNIDYQKYYLVYSNENVIGITGLYSTEDVSLTKSIWLGWFGVLEKYRRNGFGRRILLDTINKAKDFSEKYSIKYFRLYTTEKYEPLSQKLYSEIMDMKEYYKNTEDMVIPWNNVFLNLKNANKIEKQGLMLYSKIKNT